MTASSSTQLTRRQFLGAAASVGAWASVGVRLPVGVVFAPSFFNCDPQFFAQLVTLLSEKPSLRVTLFLTVDELRASQINTNRQIAIGFRPDHAEVHSDYAKWVELHKKPLLASAEQGALWPKLATLCAREEILLASWDGFSEQLTVENQTPLFDGATVNLAQLFAGIEKSGFLAEKQFAGSAEKLTPLHAPH